MEEHTVSCSFLSSLPTYTPPPPPTTPTTQENAPILFHMMLSDHSRAELLWHRDARAELRAAMEAELRDIDREAEIGRREHSSNSSGAAMKKRAAAGGGGAGEAKEEEARLAAVASKSGIGGGRHGWNHSEFRVRYPSLEAELRIGKHYLRLLLEESQKTGTVDLHLPKPFFEALYNRMLREDDLEMKAMCLEAMCLLYTRYYKKLGAFLDTPYLVTLIATAEDYTIHDRLLLLLHALVLHVENAEMLLEVRAHSLCSPILLSSLSLASSFCFYFFLFLFLFSGGVHRDARRPCRDGAHAEVRLGALHSAAAAESDRGHHAPQERLAGVGG